MELAVCDEHVLLYLCEITCVIPLWLWRVDFGHSNKLRGEIRMDTSHAYRTLIPAVLPGHRQLSAKRSHIVKYLVRLQGS